MKFLAVLVATGFLSGCATVTEAGSKHKHSGVASASWYFEGARTADGKRFNPDALTVAHRTLPFGTRIRFTNPANNLSVVAVVNDRGPAKWTRRDWDLSRGAAKRIQMLNSGVAVLRWEIVETSER